MATWSDQGYFPSNSAENVDRSNYQASPIWYQRYQPTEDKPDENQMLLCNIVTLGVYKVKYYEMYLTLQELG